jgi:4-amino-4-deoxychorismate lyase
VDSFFTSIKCIDGVPQHLQYHERRLRTIAQDFNGKLGTLAALLQDAWFQQFAGVSKLRIVHTANDLISISAEQYTTRALSRLYIVDAQHVAYDYKYSNRQAINMCRSQVCNLPDEDIIMIDKNGNCSDSSYANLCFWDGANWFTPDTPLLLGTMRARLLDERKIRVQRITPADIKKFKLVCLINALNELGSVTLPIEGIVL